MRSMPYRAAQLIRLERTVGACEATREAHEGVGHVGEERLGQSRRRHGAERVAHQTGVFGGDPTGLAREPQATR